MKKNPLSIADHKSYKTRCKTHKVPAYLFWKLQSHLVKLAHQLRRQKLKTAQADQAHLIKPITKPHSQTSE